MAMGPILPLHVGRHDAVGLANSPDSGSWCPTVIPTMARGPMGTPTFTRADPPAEVGLAVPGIIAFTRPRPTGRGAGIAHAPQAPPPPVPPAPGLTWGHAVPVAGAGGRATEWPPSPCHGVCCARTGGGQGSPRRCSQPAPAPGGAAWGGP